MGKTNGFALGLSNALCLSRCGLGAPWTSAHHRAHTNERGELGPQSRERTMTRLLAKHVPGIVYARLTRTSSGSAKDMRARSPAHQRDNHHWPVACRVTVINHPPETGHLAMYDTYESDWVKEYRNMPVFDNLKLLNVLMTVRLSQFQYEGYIQATHRWRTRFSDPI